MVLIALDGNLNTDYIYGNIATTRIKMIKWIIATLLAIAAIPQYSHASPGEDAEGQLLFQLGCAVETVIRNQPIEALEYFEHAQKLVNNLDCSYLPISFIISFGRAAIYDSIHRREQCLAALGSMFLATTGCDDKDDDTPNMIEQLQYNDENSIFYGQIIDILRSIAKIAPSDDVQTLLQAIVDDIEEELNDPFS